MQTHTKWHRKRRKTKDNVKCTRNDDAIPYEAIRYCDIN